METGNSTQCARMAGYSELYLMRADGNGVLRLTEHPAQDSSPA